MINNSRLPALLNEAANTVPISTAPSQFYNEMLWDSGEVRPRYTEMVRWLSQQSADRLEQLNGDALEHFYKAGISFTVYSDAENTQRVIPFDIIPRIINTKEWQILESGCAQRIRALNAFLHDIYHQQNIIRAGIIPAVQIMNNDCFQPWMLGKQLAGQVYAQVSGIDLVRDGEGNYCVLEDNLRTPSGVSYMLESRRISEQLMPDMFSCQKILGVEDYPQLLKQTLLECSSADAPQIVVLTPGRFNSAYYEHAFLAREMGVPLVAGSDLYVDGTRVFMRTVTGAKQVDVIYRRIDDPFLDSLAFRPDSMLGV